MLGRRLLVLLLTCGCASNPAANDDSSQGGSGGGTSLPPAACPVGPGYADNVEQQLVDSVSARLVDLDEQPVANEAVQLCGVDVCRNGKTTSTGGVTISSGELFRKPAFKPGEGLVTARFALLLPTEAEVDLGTVHTVRLPAPGNGARLVPGEAAVSAGLSLELDATGRVVIDQLTFRSEDEQQLRAVRLLPEALPELVPKELGLELLFAASPTEAVFCPPAKLTIPNSEGWEADTDVQVYLHGVGIEEAWAPYGGWAPVASARVSADGARIETTEGLPVLGVLGFKRP